LRITANTGNLAPRPALGPVAQGSAVSEAHLRAGTEDYLQVIAQTAILSSVVVARFLRVALLLVLPGANAANDSKGLHSLTTNGLG